MSVLTVPPSPHYINKVTELAQDPRPVSAFSDTFFILANQSSDPAIKQLAASWIVHYEFEEAIKNSSESKVVMCESSSSLQYILRFIQRIILILNYLWVFKVKIYKRWKINSVHNERKSFLLWSILCTSKRLTLYWKVIKFSSPWYLNWMIADLVKWLNNWRNLVSLNIGKILKWTKWQKLQQMIIQRQNSRA